MQDNFKINMTVSKNNIIKVVILKITLNQENNTT